MWIARPSNFVEADFGAFEEWLKTANDYVRDGFGNGVWYAWRHNGKRFAWAEGIDGHAGQVPQVWVDPKVLA